MFKRSRKAKSLRLKKLFNTKPLMALAEFFVGARKWDGQISSAASVPLRENVGMDYY
jgi:hypothetical protein